MKSKMLRLSRAVDEYFSGDKDLLSECGISERLTLFISCFNYQVRLAPPGIIARPGDKIIRTFELRMISGFHPVSPAICLGSLSLQGPVPARMVWLREKRGNGMKSPSWLSSPEVQKDDRQAWFDFKPESNGLQRLFAPRWRHRIRTSGWESLWVYRSELEKAIANYFGDSNDQVKRIGWPWGTHETNLLRELAAAAERFWVRYDPSDATTAPTNDAVSEWLHGRGVSSRIAEAMASMLRPTDIKRGPRS